MSQKQPHSSNIDSLRSQFKVMQQCPLCDNEFDVAHIRTVQETPDSHVLHITCSACQHAIVILIGVTDIGVGILGLTSDLTYDDMYRIKTHTPMDDDALLDAYRHVHTMDFVHHFSN